MLVRQRLLSFLEGSIYEGYKVLESFRTGSPLHCLNQGLATFHSDTSCGDHCFAT